LSSIIKTFHNHMVAEVEEEIQKVAGESNLAEESLERGCDEYNGMAMDLAAKFKPIINGLSRLNEHTMTAFESTPDEVYQRILPLMLPLYNSCVRNIDLLKASPVGADLTDLILEFEDEASQLMENQTDIQMIHKDFPEDEELQYLLSQL